MSYFAWRKKEDVTMKKKVLVWETMTAIAGGQKMTLLVMDLLKESYDFFCLIPSKGKLSDELDKRHIPYALMGDQSMPTGVKGKQVMFRYGWLSAKNILKSLVKIASYKPDILYAPGPAALPWSAVCGVLTRKPVVWHLHHLFLDGATKKLLNICARWRCVEKIIAVSHAVGDQIVNECAHKKVYTIYNPIDVTKYANGNPDRIFTEINENLKRKKNPQVILAHIGTITKNKCQDLFLKIVCEIKKRDVDVVGIMVGDAITLADQHYKQELIKYIRENGLERNVYVPGFRSDIADILAATNCVVITSNEGLGLVAMEAMSSKTRVVGLDRGGTSELFKAAKCGFTYLLEATEIEVADVVQRALKEPPTTLEAGYTFCQLQSKEHYQARLKEIFR